jgi:hypothetical protein
MVSLSKIDSIEGQYVKIANKELPVGNKYKNNFFKIISLTGKKL